MKYTYVLVFMFIILTIYYFYNKTVNKHDHFKSNFDGLYLPDFKKEECKKLKKNYKIKTFNNFLTHDECDFFINYGKKRLKRSRIKGKNSNVISEYRTSKNTWINLEYNQITEKISKRISKITNLPWINQEDIQILKYDIGDYYKCHYDNFGGKGKNGKSGPRIYTFFVYLNDVEKGGETFFPNIDLKFKPKKGMAILFKNNIGNNNHPCSLHEGVPPMSGEKWAMNIWVREKNFQPKTSLGRFIKKMFFRTGLYFV